MRVLIALAFVGLMAACQPATINENLAGSGKLVLYQPVADIIDKMNSNDRIVYETHLAIDRQSRNLTETFCNAPPPTTCYHEKFDTPEEAAIAQCNADGKYDCAIYASYQRVIWKGPVYLSGSVPDNYRPYNGIWPMELSWVGVLGSGSAELSAKNGELSIVGNPSFSHCRIEMEPLGRRDGSFKLVCSTDEAFGTYRRNTADMVRGKTEDDAGRPVVFAVDFSAGKPRLD